MTEEILKEKNNIIFENKLINNKSILKKRLAEIPRSSGCYLFKDNDGTLLYICLLYTSPSPRDPM